MIGEKRPRLSKETPDEMRKRLEKEVEEEERKHQDAEDRMREEIRAKRQKKIHAMPPPPPLPSPATMTRDTSWTEIREPGMPTFYFNTLTEERSWKDPRPSAEGGLGPRFLQNLAEMHRGWLFGHLPRPSMQPLT